MSHGKTLAMHVLDGRKIDYQVIEFPETIHDALGVAEHAHLLPGLVYKTLVVQVVDPATPGAASIAQAAADPRRAPTARWIRRRSPPRWESKRVAMARQADAERLTGLKVGGISALALLHRGFDVYVDEPGMLLDAFVISAGQRGLNLRLAVDDFVQVTGARWLDAGRDTSG